MRFKLLSGALLGLAFFLHADTLIVGINEFEPCVITKGKPSGFDIELWEQIASDAGLMFRYHETKKFSTLLHHVEDGYIDVGVAGITITAERESDMDFSHPYLSSGLNILVRSDRSANPLRTLVVFFASSWDVIIIFLTFLSVSAILIWRVEKGKPSFDDNIKKGFGDGLYWTNTTMTSTGYGDKTPMTPAGKFLAVLVMWIGIYVISPYVIAKMNVAMTQNEIYYAIRSKRDLKNHVVTTVRGTTTEKIAQEVSKKVVLRDRIEECLLDLDAKKADALIFDTPILKNLQKKNNRYTVVGETFDDQSYGFALSQGSPYREVINRALLGIQRDGRYKAIYDKWFKEE